MLVWFVFIDGSGEFIWWLVRVFDSCMQSHTAGSNIDNWLINTRLQCGIVAPGHTAPAYCWILRPHDIKSVNRSDMATEGRQKKSSHVRCIHLAHLFSSANESIRFNCFRCLEHLHLETVFSFFALFLTTNTLIWEPRYFEYAEQSDASENAESKRRHRIELLPHQFEKTQADYL